MRADAARHRDILVDAAARVFAENGFDVALSEVLNEAELGRGTLYRNFASREELIMAVVEAETHRLGEDTANRLNDPDFFMQFLEEQSRSAFALLPILNAMCEARLKRFLETMTPIYDEILESVLSSGKKHGAAREDLNRNDLRLAVTMLSAVRGPHLKDSPDAFSRSVRLLLSGLAPVG
jgi:AcrR family transcriptional regulator